MKRRLATIIMTMTLATTLVACKNNTDADANVNTGTDSELSTEATTEESDESESTEADTEETLMPAETEETESMNTDASEETTSTTKEDTSEEETESEETESEEVKETESEEVKETESEEASKEENTVSKKEDTSKKEEVKKEEPVQKEEPKKEESKKEETPSNTEVNNTPAPEVSTPAPAPAPTPAPEPACTHPQTYIKSGMHLRRESLGGGCYRDIQAAEDICLTCGAVVRSYERVGQEVHANMKRISGDSKAPTCTEDGFDNSTSACDCGSETHTNNLTFPATGHYYTTWCTGEVSEDGMKAQWVTACSCGDVQAEWWE